MSAENDGRDGHGRRPFTRSRAKQGAQMRKEAVPAFPEDGELPARACGVANADADPRWPAARGLSAPLVPTPKPRWEQGAAPAAQGVRMGLAGSAWAWQGPAGTDRSPSGSGVSPRVAQLFGVLFSPPASPSSAANMVQVANNHT